MLAFAFEDLFVMLHECDLCLHTVEMLVSWVKISVPVKGGTV